MEERKMGLMKIGRGSSLMMWLMAALMLFSAGSVHALDRWVPRKWKNAGANVTPANCTPNGVMEVPSTGGAYWFPELARKQIVDRANEECSAPLGVCEKPLKWMSYGGPCTVEANFGVGSVSCGIKAIRTSIGRYENGECVGAGKVEEIIRNVIVVKQCNQPDSYFDADRRECLCPEGIYDPNIGAAGACVKVPQREEIPPCASGGCVGDGLMPMLGAIQSSVEIGRMAGLPIRLTYQNRRKVPVSNGKSDFIRDEVTTAGRMWSSSIDREIFPDKIGSKALFVNVSRGEGQWGTFEWNGSTYAPSRPGNPDSLQRTDMGWIYRDGRTMALERYTERGVLQLIQRANGKSIEFQRSPMGDDVRPFIPEGGLVQALIDQDGRVIKFAYQQGPAGERARLAMVETAGGVKATIAYGGNQQIERIYWGDESSRAYLYENASLPWAMTGYLDEGGARALTYSYDAQGRATAVTRGAGVEAFSTTWVAPPEWTSTDKFSSQLGATVRTFALQATDVTVRQPSGQSTTWKATGDFGALLWLAKTQAPGAGSANASSVREFDAAYNITREDDFNGNRSCMTYDPLRNLEVARLEGLTSGTTCAVAWSAALPVGARRQSQRWHPDWPIVVATAGPGLITTMVYNGQPDPFNGNAVARCAPASAVLIDGKPIVVLCKRVEQATEDASGVLAFDAAPVTGAVARVRSWTYNSTGQTLTESDGRGVVVQTNEYYATTESGRHWAGDLKSSTNAQGHVTQFPVYSADGKPMAMIDPNGVETFYEYDARTRLVSSTTSNVTTTYDYWPTGRLRRVGLPDSSSVNYEYDNAGRLVAVADGQGNRIEYTLDASGNRTAEVAKDPQGTLKRTMSRVFDALGRAQQTTGRE